MGKAPAFQFYVRDWLSDPQLRQASPAARGIWIDCLCFMWESSCRGTLSGTHESLARMLAVSEDQFGAFILEVEALNFGTVTVHNKKVTLINRRMRREENVKRGNRERQQQFRNNAKDKEKVTPPSSSSSSSSSSSKRKKTFVESSDELRLASLLFELMLKNNPEHKTPNLQKWAKVFDLMIRLDSRTPGRIEEVMRWTQNHHGEKFSWSSVILSPAKLRERWGQLTTQMNEQASGDLARREDEKQVERVRQNQADRGSEDGSRTGRPPVDEEQERKNQADPEYWGSEIKRYEKSLADLEQLHRKDSPGYLTMTEQLEKCRAKLVELTPEAKPALEDILHGLEVKVDLSTLSDPDRRRQKGT